MKPTHKLGLIRADVYQGLRRALLVCEAFFWLAKRGPRRAGIEILKGLLLLTAGGFAMEWSSWAVIMLECRVNDILQNQSIFP